ETFCLRVPLTPVLLKATAHNSRQLLKPFCTRQFTVQIICLVFLPICCFLLLDIFQQIIDKIYCLIAKRFRDLFFKSKYIINCSFESVKGFYFTYKFYHCPDSLKLFLA